MTDVLIKRELLERLTAYMRQRACPAPSGKVATELHADLTAALAAPRQPEGDGLSTEQILEVFERNGFRIETGASFSARGQIAQLLNAVGEICRLPDAQRAIAELREECEHWKSGANAEAARADELKAERETLRQQRNKMVGLLMEADASFVDGSEAGLELSDRIHAALAEVSK